MIVQQEDSARTQGFFQTLLTAGYPPLQKNYGILGGFSTDFAAFFDNFGGFSKVFGVFSKVLVFFSKGFGGFSKDFVFFQSYPPLPKILEKALLNKILDMNKNMYSPQL